ncbi:non-ribosomal peptide synthetase [Novosphingobium pentaromativorans]|uniref:non-ribosomal peptide synthetase n=1 Tax=Novosphingobium pentaromativorans TaxID=205844 RepID=UPI000AEB733D
MSGAGLARGYHGRPGLTASRFVASPFGDGERLYRTGDRGAWRADGQLVYHGRGDDQVKLRGFRIEPAEIEAALLDQPEVVQAAVVVRGAGADARLVGYVVVMPGAGIDVTVLRTRLAERLPGYMVPAALVALDRLPLTVNGKLDRGALPEPTVAVTEHVAPATPDEVTLCAIVAELVGAPQVGMGDNFFHLGGHSLMAVRLVARLRERLGREVSVRMVFEHPVLQDLANAIAKTPLTSNPVAASPDPDGLLQPFALTPVQQAYWLGRQQLVALGEVACHAYVELRATRFDPARFASGWRQAIDRHPVLREVIDTDGVQRVLDGEIRFAIEPIDVSHLSPSQAETEVADIRRKMSHQLLSPDRAPLFDVRVTRVADEDWRIHMSFDALILDGESINLLLAEVFAVHAGQALTPAPALTFRDHVIAQARNHTARMRAEAYWRSRIETLPPAPALPLAVSPSQLRDHRFGRRAACLSPTVWSRMKRYAADAGLTPTNLLLTAYAEVVATWASEDDFTLNLTVGNRPDGFEGVLGVFTTLLPLEIRGARRGSFRERASAQGRQMATDLDHMAFGGVEVQRLKAQAAGDPEAGLLPVVFTSVIGETDVTLPEGVTVAHAITQTPQTWLDCKVFEEGFAEGVGLGIDWDAPEALFPPGLLDDMFAAYVQRLECLAEPEAWEATDAVLTPPAQLALFAATNATQAEASRDLLHAGMLRAAARHAAAPALITPDGTVTHGSLLMRATALAHQLLAVLRSDDALVAIVMEKGPEQVVAALAVLLAGRAFLPISAGQPDRRIAGIMDQAGVRVAITQTRIERGRDWQTAVTLFDAPETDPAVPPPPIATETLSPEALAYVIYTSGSTGVPKGVAIAHRAAVNTLADLGRRFRITERDRVLWVSSFEFDLSIFDIFGVLGAGGAIVIPPVEGAQDPAVWADLIRVHDVTVWNSVPMVAELMLAATPAPQVHLASLRLVLLSGDWIPLALPPRLRTALAEDCQLISLGGATEAAIWSILHPIVQIQPDWISIPYGRPLANQHFHVLKPDLSPCPVYTPGRLFIAGAGLAEGYWRNREETASRFVRHPATGERLYDTGDLGRYRPDGEIEFLGRQDNQVKLRGFRIELGEIEAQMLRHPAVEAAAVLLVADGSRRQLVGYYVAGACAEADLRAWLEDRLPDYMTPTALVRLDALPLTRNGKLDRKALMAWRPIALAGDAAPQTPAETWFCDQVANLLGLERVGPQDNFFHLGGDSIIAIRLVNAARNAGFSLAARDVFLHPVIRQIAERSTPADASEDIEAAFHSAEMLADLRRAYPDAEDFWPLTPLQQGIWFHAAYGGAAADGEDPYLVQLILTFEGVLDAERLRCSFQALLERHRSLRVSFHEDGDKRPVQLVMRDCAMAWREMDLTHLAPEQQANQVDVLARVDRADRIALDTAPLMRATLLKLASGRNQLLLSQHHLLGDGWATTIFFRDLVALYRADGVVGALPPPADFGGYLAWHAGQDREAAREAWGRYLDGLAKPTLVVPDADRSAPAHQAMQERLISRTLSTRLTEMAREHGLTLASVLQGVWGLTLGLLLNRTDVCFGVVSSGRQAPVAGIEDMLGAVITTTPVRLSLRGGRTSLDLLQELQRDAANLMPHQHLSLIEIHKHLGVESLFDTLFTYENYPVEPPPPAQSPDDLPLTDVSGHNSNHYPLSVAVLPGPMLGLRFHYNADLLPAGDVRRYADAFVRLLEQVTRAPLQPIARLDVLPAVERARLLDGLPPPTSLPTVSLASLFESQVAAMPGMTAIIDGDQSIDYATLDAEANRLAWRLIGMGIGPGDIVATQFARSEPMVRAVLAVMKAGAAFMPLDPGHPPERLAQLLADATPKLTLTTGDLSPRLPADLTRLLLDDAIVGAEIADESEVAPRNEDRTRPLQGDHPAYLIHTSGSTGRPKGVLVPHRGLPSLAAVQADRLGIGPGDRVVQLASCAFDASVSELAMTLTRGATLVIAGVHERAGDDLARLLDSAAITHATFTPTALQTLSPQAGRALQAIIVAGEACPADLVAAWSKRVRLFNAYGPTETTVCATMSAQLADDGDVTIGRAIAGVRVYVLDSSLRPCQSGTIGELYIGGDALAQGYFAQPALTALRFVADPFARASGARMYRTGDLAAWRADGQLDFHGRADDQVKIRGVRVEPGEVAAAIAAMPLVDQVAVDAAPNAEGRLTLTAYVSPVRQGSTIEALRRACAIEHVDAWREIEDDGVVSGDIADPTFDTRGWNSAYTGEPLSNAEMRDYVEGAVARIKDLAPRRVLEIGCGAGLITFPLLGMTGSYVGIDISRRRIAQLRSLQANAALMDRMPGLAQAVFQCAAAHEIEQLALGKFDTIILPSVVQYFADETYLIEIISQLIGTSLEPDGTIFLGDIRHKGLQNAFNLSVEWHRGPPDMHATELRELVRRKAEQERELLLNPAFFMTLRERFSQITQIDVLPKAGEFPGELNQFRYDVLIRTDGDSIDASAFEWVDGGSASIASIQESLITQPRALALRAVPNALTIAACCDATCLLEGEMALLSPGVEPKELRRLGEALGYRVDISLAAGHSDASLDVLFRAGDDRRVQMPGSAASREVRPPVGSPLDSVLGQRITRSIREALEAKLAAPFIPQDIVLIDALPMTASGKLNRQALRGMVRRGSRPVQTARNARERVLCAIVAELLSLDAVDLDGNFFHLGGDSISSIRLVSLAREQGLLLSPRDVFLHPVLRDLAANARFGPQETEQEDVAEGGVAATPIIHRTTARSEHWRSFHQASVLFTPAGLNIDALERALAAIIAHHDALRLTVNGAGEMSIPAPDPGPPVSLRRLMTAGKTVSERDAALKAAYTDAIARLDPSSGRMVDAVWADAGPSQLGHLLIVIHHFAVDGASWRILAEDLARAYAQAEKGGRIDLGRKTTSFRQWSLAQDAAISSHRNELPYWQGMVARAGLTLTSDRLDPQQDLLGDAGYISRSLDSGMTSDLLTRVPSTFRARINDVLLTALVLAVTAWSESAGRGGRPALTLDLEGHGREPLDAAADLTRTVGWFTSLFPVHLDAGDIDLTEAMAGGSDAGQALKRIKEQLRTLPHAGVGYGLLRYLDDEGQAALGGTADPQIAFNYLGRFGRPRNAPFAPADTYSAVFGGAERDRPLDHMISLNCAVHETPDGPRLDATWQYAPRVLGEGAMHALADAWGAALQALVCHAATPGAGGPSPSDFDLVSYDQVQIDAFAAIVPELEDIWPLTAMQAGLLFHSERTAGQEDPYLVQLRLDLDGPLDPGRLQRALNALVKRHPGLTARLVHDRQGRAVQLVPSQVFLPLKRVVLQDGTSDSLERIATEDRMRGFDLFGGPLIRASLIEGDGTCEQLLLTMHHMVVDGWSGALLLQELDALYRHNGDGAMLPHPARFNSYLSWLRAQDEEEACDAWRTYLDGLDSTPLTGDKAGSPQGVSESELSLSCTMTAQLEALAIGEGVTLATVVQGAWALLLARLSGRDDFCLGVVSAGRHAAVPNVERIVGMLITTTPFRVKLSKDEPVGDFLRRQQREQGSMIPYQHLPLSEISRLAGGALFDTLFTFENFPAEGEHGRDGGLPLASVSGSSGTHYPLSLIVQPGPALSFKLHLSGTLASASGAELLSRLEQLLKSMLADRQADVAELDPLLPGEKVRLTQANNETVATVATGTVVDLFEAIVVRFPDHGAVTDKGTTLSYRQLDEQANRLAWRLIAEGVGPGDVVAIQLPRGAATIVTILAILKAGGAYLPIEPDSPVLRRDFSLEQTQPKVIVTTSDLAATLSPPWFSMAIAVDAAETLSDLAQRSPRHPSATDRCAPLLPQHPAYLIYTSGSTGQPKAVVNSHANLMHLMAAADRFDFTETDVWTWFHSYAFDFSVWEIWGPLLRGGRLVVVPQEKARAPEAFLALLADERVTILNQTPSAFARLLPFDGDGAGLAVRKLILGGEICSPTTAGAWARACTVHNGYGPTETTVFATMSLALDGTCQPPIGTPIANVRTYVLDQRLRPCPKGVIGDLYIAGAGLAHGYHACPALTAARFIANPFEDGQRLYRTGDRACWNDDDQLMFHGRQDGQVKLRGFRIELGEIESALCARSDIAQAAVRVRDDAERAQLMAWLVPSGPIMPDIEEARRELAQALPHYMIPAQWRVVTEIPLTPNGKLDFTALSTGPEHVVRADVAPRASAPEEMALCAIVADILGMEEVVPTDNFFDLGGHSLLAAQLAVQVSAKLGRDLSIDTIFSHPVIAEMAKRIGVVAEPGAAFDVILPIRSEGARAPIFCLHPGTGLCWPYTNLLAILDSDQPLYGIQSRGFLADAPLATSFMDVVDISLAAIRSIQPTGPYHLAGWSFGGSVAHAIATRLRAEGEAVERVLLFDAFPPVPDTSPTEPGNVWSEIAHGADLRTAVAPRDAGQLLALAKAQGHVFGSFSVEQLQAMARVVTNNARLLWEARFDRFDGEVILFEATRVTPGLDRSFADAEAWRSLSGTLRVIQVDAEHHHMLSSAAVRQIRGKV